MSNDNWPNLLEETLADIEDSGHTVEDVLYVGSLDGRLQLSWEQAAPLMDFNYYSGFGGANVCEDLCVRFTDGSLLFRREYDGSEWWGYIPAPAKNGVPFKNFKTNDEANSLAERNYPCGVPEPEADGQ